MLAADPHLTMGKTKYGYFVVDGSNNHLRALVESLPSLVSWELLQPHLLEDGVNTGGHPESETRAKIGNVSYQELEGSRVIP